MLTDCQKEECSAKKLPKVIGTAYKQAADNQNLQSSAPESAVPTVSTSQAAIAKYREAISTKPGG